MKNTCKECNDECLYCDFPCKEAVKYLGWKDKAIKKIEKALKKKGFKEYKGLNVNGMLWFIINFWEDINIWEEFKDDTERKTSR